MKKNSNRIALFNIASTVILQGLAFFAGPIFSGLLDTANYGIASVYSTWVLLASTVFTLQAGGTVALARSNFPEEDQEAYQSSVLSLSTILYFGFSIVAMAVSLLLKNRFGLSIPLIATGLLHGWGMYCVTFTNAKFTYEFKAGRNFILSVLTSGLTIGLSIILIKRFPPDINYWGRVLGQSVIYTLLGVILFFGVWLKGKKFYDRTFWVFTLPIAIPTVFHSVAGIVLNQSDKVMLKSMVSSSSAGIYALALTFSTVMATIKNALNHTWAPFYFEYTKNREIREMREHARNYIELFTILAIGFILLCREVFHLYANVRFWSGTNLIPLFVLGDYFVFLYTFPVNYEFYHKKTTYIAFGTSGAAFCNIVLNYLLIKFFGITGAVVATLTSHGLQFLFHYIVARNLKMDEFPFSLMDFIPGLCAVCLSWVVYVLTPDLWFIRWGLGVSLGVYLVVKILKRKVIF